MRSSSTVKSRSRQSESADVEAPRVLQFLEIIYKLCPVITRSSTSPIVTNASLPSSPRDDIILKTSSREFHISRSRSNDSYSNGFDFITSVDGPSRSRTNSRVDWANSVNFSTAPVIELTTVKCASVIANLSGLRLFRESLLSEPSVGKVLRQLISWVDQCSYIMRFTEDFNEDHASFDLISHVCNSIASLCGVLSSKGMEICPEKDVSLDSEDSERYWFGQFDSYALREGLPDCLVSLLDTCLAEKSKLWGSEDEIDSVVQSTHHPSQQEPRNSKTTIVWPEVMADASNTCTFESKLEGSKYDLAHFKMHGRVRSAWASHDSIRSDYPPNRLPPGTIDLFARIFRSLASRKANRSHLMHANVPLTLCMMLINAVSWKSYLERMLEDHPSVNCGEKTHTYEEFKHEEEDKDKYVSRVAHSTLSALLEFLYVDSRSSNSSRPSQISDLLLRIITHGEVLEAIKSVLTFPRGMARLAALRVLGNLPLRDYDLVANDITDALVFIAKENSTSTKTDKNSKEELMYVCRVLAESCQTKQEANCLRLCKNGLASIALSLIKNTTTYSDPVISHQALRCMASICNVVNKLPRDQLINHSFVESLKVFVQLIDHDDLNMQEESLRGIARLAVDDQFSVFIVFGDALHKIIHLIINDKTPSELKDLAQHVLKRLGFKEGLKDLELVGRNCETMAEWFYMKRAIKVQEIAHRVISERCKCFFEGAIVPSNAQNIEDFVKAFDNWRLLGQNYIVGKGKGTQKDIAVSNSSSSYLRQIPYAAQEAFFSSYLASFCLGEAASRQVLYEEDEEQKDDFLLGGMGWNGVSGSSKGVARSWNSSVEVNDMFPPKVQEFMDFFYPSKLHQQCVVNVCGLDYCATETETAFSGSFYWPRENHVILLPSRSYVTFNRIGKIVERIIDEADKAQTQNNTELDSNHFWSLCFRSCVSDRESTPSIEIKSEFTMTFITLLRKFPQITSLSFVYNHPPKDGDLGYLIPELPSNIKFVTFEAALSSDALELICAHIRSMPRGLQGLAVKSHIFQQNDVRFILDMLDPSHFDQRTGAGASQSARSGSFLEKLPLAVSSVLFSGGPSTVPRLRSAPEVHFCGLRFLDLSNGKLDDASCAEILRAASIGQQEALELGGNFIGKRCIDEVEAMSLRSASRLHYLGFSNSRLSDALFGTLLAYLCDNISITSIDLSHNALNNTANLKPSLLSLMRCNKHLRFLDLSHNKFNAETTKALYVGILDNKSLFNVRLIGNGDACGTFEAYFKLQDKLLQNRKRYVMLLHKVPAVGISLDGIPIAEVIITSTQADESSTVQFTSCSSERLIAVTEDIEEEHLKSAIVGEPQKHLQKRIETECTVENQEVVTTVSLPEGPSRSIETKAILSSAINTMADNCPAVTNVLSVLFSVPLAWKGRDLRLHGIEMLDYGAERDMLCQLFREVRRDISVHFDFATTDRLRTAVTLGCRALHFSGHGHPSCLNFEDGRSGLQLVTVETLRDLCIAGGSKLEFVFVSACHSKRAGEAFAQAGVKHVVCVKVDARLLDAAANVFTRAFYISLAVGNTVQQAFDIGKQAVLSSPYIPNSSAEGEKFMLLPEDADHDIPVFVCNVVSQWPLQGEANQNYFSSVLPQLSLPQPPEDFEGREVDMHRVITLVLSRRLVSLVGVEGIGKSSVVAASAIYIAERRLFEDGIIFVKLLGIRTYRHFLRALQNAMARGE